MQRTQHVLMLILFCLLAGGSLVAQVNHPTSGTVNETVACGSSVTYYDSGGAGGNYTSNQSGTVNFCPSTPGAAITIDFNLVDLEVSTSGGGSQAGGCCWDALTISDANGTLFEGCGEDDGDGQDACNIDGGAFDLDAGASFTSTAADGCLTVSFISDTSLTEQGWEAEVYCGDAPPPSADINHPTTGTVNETVTCGMDINYYDSGGPGGNYASNESGTVNFCPDVPGQAVTIQFSEVDIEAKSSSPGCWDFLTISDDNGTLFDGCGEPNGDGDQAGPGADDLDPGDSFTSTAANGCLTVSFDSDDIIPEKGWAATVSCSGGGSVMGCTDPGAANYNPAATIDDGSCFYPVGNDECFDAIPIVCGDEVEGSTENATFEEGAPTCEEGEGSNPGAPGVWYSFVGDGAEVTVSLCGSNYDTQLAIYDGNCDGLLECVEDNDDNCGLQSEITFVTEIGVTYYILVNGFGGSTGDYVLSLICGCDEEAPVPGPFWQTDIGNANGDGYANNCDGTICVESYGFPVPNADLTHFVYTCICGNGSLTVKVESVTPSSARGGIMFRESDDPGARKAALKTQNTLSTLLWRDVRLSPNGFQHSKNIPIPGHMWLRLVRNGNYFQGYASQTGVVYYFLFSQYIPMGTCIDIGMYVESPTVNTLAQACFSNIDITGGCIDNLVQAPGTEQTVALFELEQDFTVFPNPATEQVNVDLGLYVGQAATVVFSNSLGQVLELREIEEVQETTERFNTKQLSNGVYFISVKTEDGQTSTKKVIISSTRP